MLVHKSANSIKIRAIILPKHASDDGMSVSSPLPSPMKRPATGYPRPGPPPGKKAKAEDLQIRLLSEQIKYYQSKSSLVAKQELLLYRVLAREYESDNTGPE